MATESPTHHAPVWLFSFVDLAFLLLIAMTQLDEGRELAVELGEIVVPRIHASAEGMPSAAAARWQLRVHPEDEAATSPFELVLPTADESEEPGRAARRRRRCARTSRRSRTPAWRGRSSRRTRTLAVRTCSTPSASSKKSGLIADVQPWRPISRSSSAPWRAGGYDRATASAQGVCRWHRCSRRGRSARATRSRTTSRGLAAELESIDRRQLVRRAAAGLALVARRHAGAGRASCRRAGTRARRADGGARADRAGAAAGRAAEPEPEPEPIVEPEPEPEPEP